LSERTASIVDLAETYLHLSDGAAVSAIEVGPNFWSTLRDRTDLQAGRLVVITHEKADWSTWEMHPAGDEVVALLSGEVDLVLQDGPSESTLSLKGRATVIVPQGVWHRAIVRKPAEMLFITRGAGTQHRPV
jgi:mannose-6-phosphate isomerase-like protein (cupin superfamily)